MWSTSCWLPANEANSENSWVPRLGFEPRSYRAAGRDHIHDRPLSEVEWSDSWCDLVAFPPVCELDSVFVTRVFASIICWTVVCHGIHNCVWLWFGEECTLSEREEEKFLLELMSFKLVCLMPHFWQNTLQLIKYIVYDTDCFLIPAYCHNWGWIETGKKCRSYCWIICMLKKLRLCLMNMVFQFVL